MASYEARADKQNQVGGPKPGEQNKFTQATVFISNRSIVSQHFPFTTVTEKNQHVSKELEVKDSLGRFMESIMAKTGAMRKLVRELKTQYVDPAAGQFLGLFEKHLDPSHAICNFSSLCQSWISTGYLFQLYGHAPTFKVCGHPRSWDQEGWSTVWSLQRSLGEGWSWQIRYWWVSWPECLLVKANTIPSHQLSTQFFLWQGLSRMRNRRWKRQPLCSILSK